MFIRALGFVVGLVIAQQLSTGLLAFVLFAGAVVALLSVATKDAAPELKRPAKPNAF